MDGTRRTVLLTFIVGYFFIVAVVLFLIPRLGVQIIYEGLVVWIVVVLAIALIVRSRMKGPTPEAKSATQKRHEALPEAILI